MLFRKLLHYVISGVTMADSHFLIAWAMDYQHGLLWVHSSTGYLGPGQRISQKSFFERQCCQEMAISYTM